MEGKMITTELLARFNGKFDMPKVREGG